MSHADSLHAPPAEPARPPSANSANSANSATPSTASAASTRHPRPIRRVAGITARFKASLLGRDPDMHVTGDPPPEPHTTPESAPPSDSEGVPMIADRDFAESPWTPSREGGGADPLEARASADGGEEGERGRERESRLPWRPRSMEGSRWKAERPWRRRVWQAHDRRGGTTEAGHAVKSSQALLYGSPAPRRRLSRTESGQEVEEKAWNEESLLRMTDWWRQVLVAGETPGQHELRMLNSFLAELLGEETPALEVILRTRLHKLLEAVVEADVVVQREGPVEKWFHQLARKALEVQRKWTKELDGKLDDCQEERKMLCSEGGRLWGVHLCQEPHGVGLKWKADTISSGGLADFEPGAWWLNDTCAQRDGIVGDSRGYVATQHSEPVITLEIGEEVTMENSNATKYIYEGPMRTLMVPLLRLLDKQVRVLRVYTLKSKLAPSAGLRYDGLYHIMSYSYRRVGTTDERFHVEITMERSKEQGPMEKVLLVPTPSMLDDWEVYLGIVEEKVRSSVSRGQYEERQQNETEEEQEREEWHKRKADEADLREESAKKNYLKDAQMQ